jgi:transposase
MLAPPRVSIIWEPVHRFLKPIEEVTVRISGSSARRAVQALGKRGKTTRIPDEVRSVVLAYAVEARSAGQTWGEIGEAVGLSETVLQRWNRAGARKGKLKPVVITPTSSSALSCRIILTTTGGERLEGLGVEDAIRVLRGLR